MSADLLSGATTEPQSLNKFGYTSNSPISFIDPTGLVTTNLDCDIHPDARCIMGSPHYCGYVVDGQPVPCSTASSMISSGVAARCPNNVCTGLTLAPNPSGGSSFFRGHLHEDLVFDCTGTVSNPAQSCSWSKMTLEWVSDVDSPFGECNSGCRAMFLQPDSAKKWSNAATTAEVVGFAALTVPTATAGTAELLATPTGEWLLTQSVLNQNNFLRIGWSGVGPLIVDYLPAGGAVLRIAIGAKSWGWPFPIHIP